jgi:hypothetical protein
VTDAYVLIRLVGRRTRSTAPTQPLLDGQAQSPVMPLLVFAYRCHPVCGPLSTTRWLSVSRTIRTAPCLKSSSNFRLVSATAPPYRRCLHATRGNPICDAANPALTTCNALSNTDRTHVDSDWRAISASPPSFTSREGEGARSRTLAASRWARPGLWLV